MGKIVGLVLLVLAPLAVPAVAKAMKKAKRNKENTREAEEVMKSSDYLIPAAARAVYEEQQLRKRHEAEEKIEAAIRSAVGAGSFSRAKKAARHLEEDE